MNRAIVTSFDANYFDYAQVLVTTFHRNYNGPDVLDFICLVPLDLVDREREFADQVNSDKLRIIFRGSEKFEELVKSGRYDFDELPHISSNAMQRLFIASTLHEYDEVIYIDPDCIIFRDVQPLLSFKLNNKIAAVQEPDSMNVISFKDPDRPYFNNGVFLTTLEYWRAENLEDRMLQHLLTNGPTQCIEQDLMNRFMFDVWAPMPFSFNFRNIDTGQKVFKDCDPLVIHFSGPDKPWHDYNDLTKYEIRWKRVFRELELQKEQ